MEVDVDLLVVVVVVGPLNLTQQRTPSLVHRRSITTFSRVPLFLNIPSFHSPVPHTISYPFLLIALLYNPAGCVCARMPLATTFIYIL
jgi:hypothetical protein